MGINFFRRQAPEATERKASVTGRIAAMATGVAGRSGGRATRARSPGSGFWATRWGFARCG